LLLQEGRSSRIKSHLAGICRRFDRYENRRPVPTMQGDRAPTGDAMPDNRNILYLIIGALVIVVAVLGYNVYQTKKQPEGLQINVGPNGLKIENK